MNLLWSEHARHRFYERHSSDVPVDRIKRAGRLVAIGEEFHISNFLHSFVCKRISASDVIVVTIKFNVCDTPQSTQQVRKAEHERFSRKSLG